MEKWCGEWMMILERPETFVMTDVLPDEDWPLVCQLLAAKSEASASLSIETGSLNAINFGAFASDQGSGSLSSKVTLSDVCIAPIGTVACDVNASMGSAVANNKTVVAEAAGPIKPASSSTSWLEWCQSNPSMLLLKDFMTFVGVDGECGSARSQSPIDLAGGDFDGLFDASCDFQFVPV
ncbi:hypothetical protein, variant 1 [Aphanomyces invadans]|uniref:Uncharacterized protein n=1 Tax=Aphanomyces invadans TaxID=157072 RepID=A0A024U8V1_9STRA|nr:hypothetical protein, variant 1 [Aphanomyces invadans]ETW02645.1 hypothetical protein, variant 1 [Aphanomyces invadans]|eukprot:XP_008869250.1 hypothetical protein, variant 1 [Aphanomyces invadans]